MLYNNTDIHGLSEVTALGLLTRGLQIKAEFNQNGQQKGKHTNE